MCRGKVKNWQGLRNELPVEREMWGSGTCLSRFERENAGLRNELDPFEVWKYESPEWPLTRGAAERFAFGAESTVGDDERVEIKEILKMMVSGTEKSAKKCIMVMLRNVFFYYYFFIICSGTEIQAENGGLSRGT